MVRLFSIHVFIYLLYIIQLTSNSVPCWIWGGFKQIFVLYSIISGQWEEEEPPRLLYMPLVTSQVTHNPTTNPGRPIPQVGTHGGQYRPNWCAPQAP